MGIQIILLALAITAASLLSYFSLGDRLNNIRNTNRQAAYTTALGNYIESYKARIRATMINNNITPSEFLAGLRCEMNNDCQAYSLFGHSPNAPAWAKTFTQDLQLSDIKPEAAAVTVRLSPNDEAQQRLTFKVKPMKAGAFTEKEIELRLGQNTVFKNAMTGNTFKCLFCHAKVMGDVANYRGEVFQWSQATKVHGSYIIGGPKPIGADDFFTARIVPPNSSQMVTDNYPNDKSDQYFRHSAGRINIPGEEALQTAGDKYGDGVGPSVHQFMINAFMFDFKENYRGSSLPWNYVRQRMMLPKFDPNVMKDFAAGSVTAQMIKVPLNTKVTAVQFSTQTVEKNYEGNLILNGRNQPIKIDGRIFVSGDIIVFGQISGTGSLYAGRNIYIADNLTYLNPPPHFDGSKSSNDKMNLVSLNGDTLANEMRTYDRLSVFATNNIIIGDPFNTFEQWNDPDMIFNNASNLEPISESRELAYDPENGQMFDRESMGNKVCYLKPWEDRMQCRFKQGAFPDVSEDLVVTPVLPGHAVPAPALVTNTDKNTAFIRAFKADENHRINFLPNNFKKGAINPWIDKDTYMSVTVDKDGDEYKNTVAADAYNRRGRYILGQFLPPGNNVYSSTSIDTALIKQDLEAKYGLITALESMNAGQGDTVNHRASDRLTEFLDKCRLITSGADAGTMAQIYPKTGFDGNTHELRFKVDGKTQARKNGTPITIAGQETYLSGYRCEFYYWPASTFPNGRNGEVHAKIDFQANRYDNLGDLQEGHETLKQCRTWDATQDAGDKGKADFPVRGYSAGTIAPPCMAAQNGSYLKMSNNTHMAYFLNTADLKISIMMLPDDEEKYQIIVNTRIYDPNKVHYRNKVEKIQAFLFANQYISYSYSNSADRQIRIHGGIVAKDFLGRFVNVSGPERQFSGANPYIAEAYKVAAGGESQPWSTYFPAAWIISDPRFQYTTDLINIDFLSVIKVK